MSTYSIETLLRLWKQNAITTEQGTGYLMQHIEVLTQRQNDLEKRLRRLEQSGNEQSANAQA